jgi:hypothetical protein
LLRAAKTVEFQLRIEEDGVALQAVYRASRGGRMRIDVSKAGQRVFSEGIDEGGAWEQAGGEARPVSRDGEAAAALRHGIDLPGKLWTLADLSRQGHRVERDGMELDGEVLRVTLRDGFTTWFVVDPKTCQITRKRDVRAFHPSLDSTRRWVETLFEDYRLQNGVAFATLSRDVDLATGKTLSTTTSTAVLLDKGEPDGRWTQRPAP